MNLYLDDDSPARQLVHGLRQAGHDVEIPVDAGLRGEDDSVHLLHAIHHARVLLTANHDDFENLHNLVVQSGGSHAGIVVVRKDDYHRDMKPAQIVGAIANLEGAGMQVTNEFIILNHWR